MEILTFSSGPLEFAWQKISEVSLAAGKTSCVSAAKTSALQIKRFRHVDRSIEMSDVAALWAANTIYILAADSTADV